MFEAHSLTSFDLFDDQISLPCRTIHRTHKDTLRPLSIWFVEGETKARGEGIKRTVFVYTEYRDDQGNRGFKCQSYLYPACLTQKDLDRYIEGAIVQSLDS